MNARALTLLFFAAAIALLPSSARAEPPAFDESETRALQDLIQTAVSQALAHPSVGDGNPRTQPPATVVWSQDAPNLSEPQRVALQRMVDEAVQRVLAGELPVVAAGEVEAAPPAADETGVDPSLPMTDLTQETLLRLAAEQGFDVDATTHEVTTGAGQAQTALVLTDVGLNSAPTTPAVSNLQLIASTEGSRASLKIDQSSGAGDTRGGSAYWARSLVFSAPVDKNDAVGTELIGLDGLTNGFEVAYNFSRLRTEPLGRPGDGQRSLLFAMPAACRELGIAMDECDWSVLLRVARTKAKDAADPNAAAAKRIAADFALTGRTWVQGFRLKAGYDDFTFYDAANLAKHTQDEVPWSTGVFAGVLSGTSYYSAGLDYQRSYKAATAGVACPAAAENSAVTLCVNGPLGAPTPKEKHLVTLEGRWLLGTRAVGAKLVHDFRNDHWGVDVPVYLFPNEKGPLSGGLRFGWTDTDKFSAGIFVGVPFKLLD